jgi:hypothetical protein
MKIIREKATNKVFYLFDELVNFSLNETNFQVGNEYILSVNGLTHEIVDGPPPDEWISGGALAFDGTWFIADQPLVDQYQQIKIEARAKSVRDDRNTRLSDSDWTQVADAPVDQTAWAAYRQALRDISDQEGFPWTINWPTQP